MSARYLYIFPHPDDESFGPAAAIHGQLEKGHEVFLLTLTRGGATKQRHKLGLSVEEMGEVRYKEMVEVEKRLGLTGMTVLDFPDSGLKEMNPREIEKAVREHVEKIKPQIVVSYPVHGISGFHDHIVAHSAVKRLYLDPKADGADWLERLAFITLPDSGLPTWGEDGAPRMKLTGESLIDAVIHLSPEDIEAMKRSLAAYTTYQETIEKSGVVEKIGDRLYFEIFGEDHDPVLTDLAGAIPVLT